MTTQFDRAYCECCGWEGRATECYAEHVPPECPSCFASCEIVDLPTAGELREVLEVTGAINEDFIPDVDEIATWTEQERDEVWGWASAAYLDASDNVDVVVPPVPKVVSEYAQMR